MATPTPADFLATVISMWEGGYESYVDDAGNWVTFPDGHEVDVGTNRGVTPAALAAHRGVEPYQITMDDIKSVTLDEAVDIGLKHYYQEPGFAKLPWGPATAALVDFGWGSGPFQAVLSMQRLCDAQPVDGIIGPATIKAYTDWEAQEGWVAATDAVHNMRAAFYRFIAEANPANQQFLQGWLNRADWASAANAEWWSQWGVG